MEQWFEKMKEYLNMDGEISFEEFVEYSQGFIAFISPVLDTLDKDDMLKARFILSILQSNADDRSKRKGDISKKYKKLAQKCGLWLDAVTYRLAKSGMSPIEIDQAVQAISDSI